VWDGSQCSIIDGNTCIIPEPGFDHSDRCFVATCVEGQCCGAGTTLVTDPMRDDPACYCTTSCSGFCKPGKNITACKPGKDGKKIQGPGKFDITGSACIFVADKDVGQADIKFLMGEAPKVPSATGMTNWADVIAKLEKKKKPIGDIVIAGHGADGGVQASGSDIDGNTITDGEAAKIKSCLGNSSRIIFISCAQGDEEDNDFIQKLADKTMRSVVANVKNVNSATKGDGDWLKFDPAM
jgi:hypothetical protein